MFPSLIGVLLLLRYGDTLRPIIRWSCSCGVAVVLFRFQSLFALLVQEWHTRVHDLGEEALDVVQHAWPAADLRRLGYLP